MKLSLSLLTILLAIQFSVAQTLKSISYEDGAQKLNGFVTSNAGKKLPGVLVLPAWMGIDKEAKNTALELEKAGYIAFVADIYGEGNMPTDYASAGKIAGKYKDDYKSYQHRITLALEQLKKAGANPDKIAVIGFCFGGTGALEVARGSFPVLGIVSIHGGLSKDPARENTPITTKVLVESAANDGAVTPEVSAALTKELNLGKTDWEMITYSNSKHTFTNPESPDYNKVMAKRAWAHTMMFLKEILK
jgi:dienelactone hydrolase